MGVFGLFSQLENLSGVAQKHLAGLGEHQLFAKPGKEFHPQVFLQLADLGAHGRLGHVELLGRAGEVHNLGRMMEGAQLVQVHALILGVALTEVNHNSGVESLNPLFC